MSYRQLFSNNARFLLTTILIVPFIASCASHKYEGYSSGSVDHSVGTSSAPNKLSKVDFPPPNKQELKLSQNAKKPDNQDLTAIKKEYKSNFLDPDSAKFRNLKVYRSFLVTSNDNVYLPDNFRYFGVFVCGEVNAKNTYGGYTGYHYFALLLNKDNPAKIAHDLDEKTVLKGIYIGNNLSTEKYAIGEPATWCKYIRKNAEYIKSL